MKPPPRQITLAAAVLGAGVVAVLAVAHWGVIQDHVEGWRFQLSTKTATILPNPAMRGLQTVLTGWIYNEKKYSRFKLEELLSLLGNHSGSPVVYDPSDPIWDKSSLPAGVWWTEAPPPSTRQFSLRPTEIRAATADLATRILRANGWRVLDLRFPRKAYVVIRDATQRTAGEQQRG
jgi:hypothetical protein